MRSNAVKKIETAEIIETTLAKMFELKLVVPAPVEAKTDESVDYEEFMAQYGMKSEFA